MARAVVTFFADKSAANEAINAIYELHMDRQIDLFAGIAVVAAGDTAFPSTVSPVAQQSDQARYAVVADLFEPSTIAMDRRMRELGGTVIRDLGSQRRVT